MAQYRRLSFMKREELRRMLAAGHSLRATAQALSRAPSTLSRELARHGTSPVTYRAVAAHQWAQRWAHHPRKQNNGVRNHFAARGGELVHLASMACLVSVDRRMRETKQTRASASLPLTRPPLPSR